MGLSLGEVVGVDVDDVAADGLGGVEGEGEVLPLRVGGQALLVDGALVDGLRDGQVDELAAEDIRLLPSRARREGAEEKGTK